MTIIFNNPADFAEEQFEGFLDLNSDRLSGVAGGAVAHRGERAQVAVVIGGGSGHYPAFCGLVGPGFAAGAVVGNIFTSPSAAQVYSVAKASEQGEGVILSFGNYAGDVMNFQIAADRLNREGIPTRIVLVTDDVASANEQQQRRGIAGDFVVFKALGAAAAAGLPLDEVERIGNAANAATRTLGVAFSGCTMPGATGPLFQVPEGHMGVGLGIHGEPGIRDVPLSTADDLAAILVDDLLVHAPTGERKRVGVVVNGLGTTKYEELFLLWRSIAPRLRDRGFEIVDPEVGELVTSLDMGGCSLTLVWLDDELERMWTADAYTPGYRKQSGPLVGLTAANTGSASEATDVPPNRSAAGAALAPAILDGLRTLSAVMEEHEDELGRIDAIAGDGDHGRGMVRGASAALAAAESTAAKGAGPGWILGRAGRAWAAAAGGTSGVLWGAGLEAAGASLDDSASTYSAEDAVVASSAFTSAITDLGRATLGDKTLVDALLPFVDALELKVRNGDSLVEAWSAAAEAATTAAEATASLSPRLGRARPLAERSIGSPDAGATSLALIVTALAVVQKGRDS
jgi:dihydroxyacetone kinase